MKAVDFFNGYEKKNNPFYPNDMMWDRNTIREMLKEFDEQNESKPFLRKYNPMDYVVLLKIGELSHLAENEIAVGVKNFSLTGQDCLTEYKYEGKKYRRKHTAVIPKSLVGQICSVQVYELITD